MTIPELKNSITEARKIVEDQRAVLVTYKRFSQQLSSKMMSKMVEDFGPDKKYEMTGDEVMTLLQQASEMILDQDLLHQMIDLLCNALDSIIMSNQEDPPPQQ